MCAHAYRPVQQASQAGTLCIRTMAKISSSLQLQLQFLLQFVMISCLFYRHYIGCKPVVTVVDPKMLETVPIKKVEDFQDPMVSYTYVYLASFLIFESLGKNLVPILLLLYYKTVMTLIISFHCCCSLFCTKWGVLEHFPYLSN